jgi:hypothetical protein
MRDKERRTITNPLVNDVTKFVKYGAETNGEYTELYLKLGPSSEAALTLTPRTRKPSPQ